LENREHGQRKEAARIQLRNVFSLELHEKMMLAEKMAKNRNDLTAELERWETIAFETIESAIESGEAGSAVKLRKTAKIVKSIREAINEVKTTNANSRVVTEKLVLGMVW
jgi:hypothetical protein